jgi:hypothetical protein
MAIYTQHSLTAEIGTMWLRIQMDLPNWHPLHRTKIGKLSSDKEQRITNETIKNAWDVYRHSSASLLAEMLLGDVKLRSEVSILQNFGTTAGSQTSMARLLLPPFATEDAVTKALTDQTVQHGIAKAEGIRLGKSTDTLVTPTSKAELLYQGCVLNDGFWWPLINDCWVLGAVHNLKVFHLALADIPEGLLWDAGEKRCRVLGRELIGLIAAGYALIGLPDWAAPKTISADDPDPSWVRKETLVPNDPRLKSEFSQARALNRVANATEIRQALGFTFAPTKKATATALSITTYLTEIDKYKSAKEIKDAIIGREVSYANYDYANATKESATKESAPVLGGSA